MDHLLPDNLNFIPLHSSHFQSWALPYLGPHLRSSIPADHQMRNAGWTSSRGTTPISPALLLWRGCSALQRHLVGKEVQPQQCKFRTAGVCEAQHAPPGLQGSAAQRGGAGLVDYV
ncbi:uncharacterized protein LOC123514212 [Portunus trituberculatus]|uniref:uncharacterized protein LOC123514212 n=1 Tax=Portunus trituberculatus TaxID=210409 RepID=UPI001E1CF1E2|nr:uncharacterized protein LOC123514212 [Portunus trituberculatus]